MKRKYRKNPTCKLCGKDLQNHYAIYCKHHMTVGDRSYKYIDGRTKKKNFCIDCDKQLTNCYAIRCRSCSKKGVLNPYHGKKDELSWNYIERPKCIICNKKIGLRNMYCGSCASKLKWENVKYRDIIIKKIIKALKITPNKPEKILIGILNKTLPNEYKYVGDGKVIIGGFNPDFINVNSQKKIIELYGDYWHSRKEVVKRDVRRLKAYRKYGYKLLIIWEHELKDLIKVKNGIINFNK